MNKYSIIIPVCNTSSTIKNAISSVLTNNCDFEIILVENGSTDHSYEVCQKISSTNDKIKLHKLDKRGVSFARNYGLEKCSGNIITFLDADDELVEHYLDKVDEIFNESNYDIVTTGVVVNNNNSNYNERTKNGVITGSELLTEIIKDYHVKGYVCSKFYKKEIIKDVRFNEDLRICEDNCFNVELLSKNRNIKVKTTGIYGYIYNKNNNNTTKQIDKLFDEKNIFENSKAMNYILDNLMLNSKEKSLIKRDIYNYAQNAFIFRMYNTKEQKNSILNDMKCSFKYYFSNIFVNSFFGNIYRLLKFAIIYIKRKNEFV